MPKELSAKEKKLKLRLENALKNGDVSLFTSGRQLFALLPSDPRCVSCMAPVGIGVHTGRAYFGAVSSADGLVELTAPGNAGNTASRLATQAAAGEIVISEDTAQKAGIDIANLEKRTLKLKAKSVPMNVWVMQLPLP